MNVFEQGIAPNRNALLEVGRLFVVEAQRVRVAAENNFSL